jgi:hypothetical protein
VRSDPIVERALAYRRRPQSAFSGGIGALQAWPAQRTARWLLLSQ